MKRKSETFNLEKYQKINRYIIGRTLGVGSYGEVKLGKDTENGIIRREITAMRSLNHENIIRLLDIDLNAAYTIPSGQTEEIVLLVLELAENHHMSDYLIYTGAFSEIQARTYFYTLICALEYCHSQGVYHRDLKPQNLLFGENFQLKIADFGLASVSLKDAPESFLETRCGTLPYTAPEILKKKCKYRGSKADIWSAGVILFVMLTGNQPPFQMAILQDFW
eukprot:CAMPEP_0117741722 /NCGR_PEP_ID=MMETSP0947-20121206/5096_1 /TAXON_ID=44440 /ORGANISM="Chattonella subsalsa, Strain CCMP2191" /LENGTH=221 /DNA_ID=CAMNT_0005558061 /DNA_START=33 /DNA_END=695 /DNA_ORIENTATION=+